MKWPWTRARDRDRETPDLENSRRELEALIAQRPDVDQLNNELRRHRIENGFARKVFSLAPPKGGSQ